MWIFGPLPCSTISAVTVTFARAAASLVTVSPSTSRMAGRATVSPSSPARRLIVNVSPTATLCWLPPAFTTAYTTDSSFASSCPASLSGAHDRSGRRVLDGCGRLPGGTVRCPRGGGATRPAYPSGHLRVDTTLVTVGGTQAGGPAGRLAARRRRGRAVTTGPSPATDGASGVAGTVSTGASAIAPTSTEPSSACRASSWAASAASASTGDPSTAPVSAGVGS